jgi:hypothetical protein
VVCVHAIDSKNGAAPPAVFVFRTQQQVHECFAGFQAAEGGMVAAVQQLESKFVVEVDRTSHITDGEGHCADVLDHPSRFHSHEYGRIVSTFQIAGSRATDQIEGGEGKRKKRRLHGQVRTFSGANA